MQAGQRRSGVEPWGGWRGWWVGPMEFAAFAWFAGPARLCRGRLCHGGQAEVVGALSAGGVEAHATRFLPSRLPR